MPYRKRPRVAGSEEAAALHHLGTRCFRGQHELCPINVIGKELTARQGWVCNCLCHEPPTVESTAGESSE